MTKDKLLIIGGTGSLGNCIVEQFKNIYKIDILSRDENKQWLMKSKYPDINFHLGDIRNKDILEEKFFSIKPNIIIIAAALKQIDTCEYNISECILTNVIGIENIIHTVVNISNKNLLPELKTICYISTDKASSPVNTYGMCKSLGERIVAEKSLSINNPKFVIVRYGNVINSRGSIIPFFKSIGESSDLDFFPLTHPDMTRFFLTLEEGVKLIKKAIDEGKNGDTYIPIVNSYKIIDIAKIFSEIYNKPIKIIGLRPGEKLHECLINESEKFRTVKKDNVYVIKPCYKNIEYEVDFDTEYTSIKTEDISIFKNTYLSTL
jgi:UDP-N-acetylglucosamine 4,6-dehydratase